MSAAAEKSGHVGHIDAVGRAKTDSETLFFGLPETRGDLYALDSPQFVRDRIHVGELRFKALKILLIHRRPGHKTVVRKMRVHKAIAREPRHRTGLFPVGFLDQVLEVHAGTDERAADVERLGPDVRETKGARVDDDRGQKASSDRGRDLDFKRADKLIDDLPDRGGLLFHDLDLTERL